MVTPSVCRGSNLSRGSDTFYMGFVLLVRSIFVGKLSGALTLRDIVSYAVLPVCIYHIHTSHSHTESEKEKFVARELNASIPRCFSPCRSAITNSESKRLFFRFLLIFKKWKLDSKNVSNKYFRQLKNHSMNIISLELVN